MSTVISIPLMVLVLLLALFDKQLSLLAASSTGNSLSDRAVHREHLTVYRHRVISHGGWYGVTAVFD
eukprot:5610-Heterococcus_DN1.PRE.2